MDIIKNAIRTIPHYPIEGVMFRDITTLLADADAFKASIDAWVSRHGDNKIDHIVGIEARGFMFGTALAYQLGTGFVPIRKKGKLPGKTISMEYDLEYGSDIIEIHDDAIKPGERVLLVDDLIATGGTAIAASDLIEKVGGKVVECCFIIDLPDLGGRAKLEAAGQVVHTLVDFEGE